MRNHFRGIAAVAMASLLWSVQAASTQEVRGRPIPEAAIRGGNVARVPDGITGMSGSAGSAKTYTGIGIPTGASSLNQNRTNSIGPNGRMSR